MPNKIGCAYGLVTRNMVDNLTNITEDFHVDIKREFKDLRETNNHLYNHLSKRLPPWATALGAIGIAIFAGLIGAVIRGGL